MFDVIKLTSNFKTHVMCAMYIQSEVGDKMVDVEMTRKCGVKHVRDLLGGLPTVSLYHMSIQTT